MARGGQFASAEVSERVPRCKVYAVGGVIFPLDHPVLLGRSFKRMVGLKPKEDGSPGS